MGKVHFTYLALGDSYTIGESVTEAQSFPFQLQNELNLSGCMVDRPRIIAKTGWTTDELLLAVGEADVTERFDFVTLLIGVNNQYRGYSKEVYREEFTSLLKLALTFVNNNKERVFVVSIPDWGVTPFAVGQPKSPGQIAEEIDTFNAINREITRGFEIDYTDITGISRRAALETDLIAEDGLHPGILMYKNWVSHLFPKIFDALQKKW